MNVSERLISWYLQNARDLPWRQTSDPYHIWLSEIILQQTRVDQGMDYYLRFVNTYPTIGFLSQAKLEDVLKLWQGLGYYSRARNLYSTANYISNELNGKFPESYENLVKLKGVGPYTAAAIASFAFKKAHAVVDGNVARVLSRIFDIELPVNGTEGAKLVQQLADECLDPRRPDLHNQAIMELGAMVCTPHQPKCDACPLQQRCEAFRLGSIAQRPVKIKKAKARTRHMHYLVMRTRAGIIFRKRTEKDIWQGLNDFHSIEGVEQLTANELRAHLKTTFPELHVEEVPLKPSHAFTHQLTHQRIEAQFWELDTKGSMQADNYFEVSTAEIEKVAVPRLIHKYLQAANAL